MDTRDYCQNMQLGDDAESRETRGKDGCRNGRRQGERGNKLSVPQLPNKRLPAFYASKGSRHRKAYLRTLARRNSPQNCL